MTNFFFNIRLNTYHDLLRKKLMDRFLYIELTRDVSSLFLFFFFIKLLEITQLTRLKITKSNRFPLQTPFFFPFYLSFFLPPFLSRSLPPSLPPSLFLSLFFLSSQESGIGVEISFLIPRYHFLVSFLYIYIYIYILYLL